MSHYVMCAKGHRSVPDHITPLCTDACCACGEPIVYWGIAAKCSVEPADFSAQSIDIVSEGSTYTVSVRNGSWTYICNLCGEWKRLQP